MGYYYNALCTDQTCTAQCCNQAGTCPDPSSRTSTLNQCWYSYTYIDGSPSCSSITGISTTCCYSSSVGYYECNRNGIIVGSVIGGVVGLIICLVCLIFVIRRRRRQKQEKEKVLPVQSTSIVGSTSNIKQGQQPAINYGNTYGAPIVNYSGGTETNLPHTSGMNNASIGMVPVQYYQNTNVSTMK